MITAVDDDARHRDLSDRWRTRSGLERKSVSRSAAMVSIDERAKKLEEDLASSRTRAPRPTPSARCATVPSVR
jgi:hypothetical protein